MNLIIKSIIEFGITKLIGTIIGTLILYSIYYYGWVKEEERKDELHKIQKTHLKATLKKEDKIKRINEEYEILLKSISINGIKSFRDKYPSDVRNYKLNILYDSLVTANRIKSLNSYILKTNSPSLDSLFKLKSLLSDSVKIVKVNNSIESIIYDETLNETNLLKIKNYVSKFPYNKDKIDSLYSKLERIYYYRFLNHCTYYNIISYLEEIPNYSQRNSQEAIKKLKYLDNQKRDYTVLSNSNFKSDALSTSLFGAPTQIYFSKYKNGAFEIDIGVDDKIINNAIALVKENKLIIYQISNGEKFEFTRLVIYKETDNITLETVYNSEKKYLKYVKF